jgi:hypothetical protein
MVKHLGNSLVDVMYIFDEPSIGMHPRDVHRLNELLQKLRDRSGVSTSREIRLLHLDILQVGAPHREP